MADRNDSADVPADTSPHRYRQRIDDLIAQMTPAEKAGQLTQYFYLSFLRDQPSFDGSDGPSQPEQVEQALNRGEVGALLFVTDPAEVNRLQRIAVEETRLGIPLLFGFDVIHGFRTAFPVPIGMAASWDPDLIERAQSIAAREASAVGIHWTFAPMVDIARDPRWGRIIEGAGEDPYLGAAVAAAQVRGFQGDAIGASEHVIAGPKHFAGYGAALGGRDYDEVNLSDSELWNVYLPPFEAAVRAGCGNIMTAYMDLNGIPASGTSWLFQDVLRDTWGFDGFVVSDANAVRDLVTHHFARDLTDAGAKALRAGVDLEMAIFDPAYASLPDAVEHGLIEQDALDASVRRILEMKFRLGLFDDPYVNTDRTPEVLDDPRHRIESRITAEQSAVLLKNDERTLPLDVGALKSIAVIGPFADSRDAIVGPWVFDVKKDETVTLLAGIREKAGDATAVSHAPGIRRAHRKFPSMFDMFPGGAPDRQPDFDDEAEFDRAVTEAREAEVAQLYIHQRYGNASRPVRELKGFQRLTLNAGESRTVQFTLGPDELRYWNAAIKDWTIDASTFDVWVGGDCTATLTTTFEVSES